MGTNRWRWFAVVVMAILATGEWAAASRLAPQPAQASGEVPARSIWDGVYTEDQARRGKDLYSTHCVSCHGENLEGSGPVKPLAGPDFAANWNGVKVGDMLERTRMTMPMDKPATLSRQQIADVLSYVLSVNKVPAGSAELPRQAELLSGITFLAQKPAGDPPSVPKPQ